MGRPRLADGFVVAFTACFGLAALAGALFRVGSVGAPEVGLTLLQAAALWWRRRHPLPVLIGVTALVLAQWILSFATEPSGLALVFAVYAVSVYGSARHRLWVAGVAIGLIALAVGSLVLDKFSVARAVMPIAGPALVAWVIGDYIRSRRQLLLDMVARHRVERAQAAEAERLRIARELHDVVAHNVSVMAIQAGAARVSGRDSNQALESIERSARETLSELNRLLGVLRQGPSAPELAPPPTLADVDPLLQPAREAGLNVSVRVVGERWDLPAAVELSAYRILQEAVTNVLKHANASRLEVVIDYQPSCVAVTVTDNGSGPAAAPSNGHGLIGMRERVDMLGGELVTGTSSLGGFMVRATLPLSK